MAQALAVRFPGLGDFGLIKRITYVGISSSIEVIEHLRISKKNYTIEDTLRSKRAHEVILLTVTCDVCIVDRAAF